MTERLAVDSSALVAILNEEPEKQIFEDVLERAEAVLAWPTVFEVRIWVLRRERAELNKWLDQFVIASDTVALPFDKLLESIAAEAYEAYGKGLHPARLNFGDCMAYAVAKSRDLPLLFKGGDFGRTDICVHEASVFA